MNATKIQRFLDMKNDDLKHFLRIRGVVVGVERHQELAEKAYWAEKLGLIAKPSYKDAEYDIENSKERKLVLDGGMV